LRPALVTTIAYLLGSIPFGYLIVRATHGHDIRETGSGGTGATNVSRRAGKGAGLATLILDALKGTIAVLIAKLLLGLPLFGSGGYLDESQQAIYWWVAAAAVAVIVGHMFPVWLGFRGGKGVATGVGVFLMLAPMAVALAAILFVLIVWKTRYVSLGSIVAAAAIPVFVLVENAFIRPVSPLATILFTSTIGAALIIFAHRGNIGRLIEGTESKFE
jgi:glycerol-3-phosphate acyltransferase PlsY